MMPADITKPHGIWAAPTAAVIDELQRCGYRRISEEYLVTLFFLVAKRDEDAETSHTTETVGSNQPEELRELHTHCRGCGHGSACMGGMCSHKTESAPQASNRMSGLAIPRNYGQRLTLWKALSMSIYCQDKCPKRHVDTKIVPFSHEACRHCALLHVYEVNGGWDL